MEGIPYVASYKWDREGRLLFKGEYDTEGKGIGYETLYHPNGTVGFIRKTSEGNVPDSTVELYNADKTIAAKLVYDKGKLLSKECFEDGKPKKRNCDSSTLSSFHNRLTQHVMRYMRYPGDALENDIQGVVLMNFIINADGSLSNIHPLVSSQLINTSCLNEAIRIIKILPAGDPIKYYNMAIWGVELTIPISFRLE